MMDETDMMQITNGGFLDDEVLCRRALVCDSTHSDCTKLLRTVDSSGHVDFSPDVCFEENARTYSFA